MISENFFRKCYYVTKWTENKTMLQKIENKMTNFFIWIIQKWTSRSMKQIYRNWKI